MPKRSSRRRTPRWRRSYPGAKVIAESGFHTVVVPLHADHVAAVRPALVLLQAGALFLLLIGAVNLVNLLLVRASARQRELAVRQALGAEPAARGWGGPGRGHGSDGGRGRSRAWRSAPRAFARVETLGASRLPLGGHVAFGPAAALAGLVAAVVLGLAVGVPVAWMSSGGPRPRRVRGESRGGTTGRAALRLRQGFLVGQIALAFMLLAATGLLGLSLRNVMAVSPGFRPDHLLVGDLSLPGGGYPTGDAILGFGARLTEAIGRQPGVRPWAW